MHLNFVLLTQLLAVAVADVGHNSFHMEVVLHMEELIIKNECK